MLTRLGRNVVSMNRGHGLTSTRSTSQKTPFFEKAQKLAEREVKQYRPSTSTVLQQIHKSVAELPEREFARYGYKNQKFPAKFMLRISECHAEYLLEHECKKGDVLAVWMPDYMPDKHAIFLTAARAGFRVVDISASITNIHRFREALALSEAKVIYFFPDHNNIDYMKLLRKSIPELFHYDDGWGQIFHSKHFPKLRWFVHCHLEVQMGCLAFDGMMLTHPLNPQLPKFEQDVNDTDPFYTRIDRNEDGSLNVRGPIPLGKVLEDPHWLFAKKLIDKEYIEFPKVKY